jgi:hypothetical protein
MDTTVDIQVIEKRNAYHRAYNKTEKGKAYRKAYSLANPRTEAKSTWEKTNRAVGSEKYIAHNEYALERRRLQREMVLFLRAFNV